mmetsp:Transcript_12443/g.28632  ORF Transcript_12443/g.28632 Transcript_12443/m.28632 type:complete len:83 (+) Transcript_12443:1617-1865(+)
MAAKFGTFLSLPLRLLDGSVGVDFSDSLSALMLCAAGFDICDYQPNSLAETPLRSSSQTCANCTDTKLPSEYDPDPEVRSRN